MSIATEEPVSLLNPTSEEAENRKKEAKDHWGVICKAGGLVSVNSLRIGFHACALKRQNLFGLLGFEDEKQAQKDSGVKDSTWFNVIRIAEAYPGVSEQLFTAMKLSNAQVMMDLPESKRLTEYWLRKAATEPIEVFKEQVDIEMNGKARASDGREASTSYKVSMPASRKKVIEDRVKVIGKELGIEDEGRVIEMVLAERTEAVSLIGAISHAIDKIAAAKMLGDSGLSAAEALEKVYVQLDEVVSEFKQALENVQNLESQ
jgi:hypothetical protein